MKGLDADDVEALARCGAEIRGWIEATPFPKQLEGEIAQGFRELTGLKRGLGCGFKRFPIRFDFDRLPERRERARRITDLERGKTSGQL